MSTVHCATEACTPCPQFTVHQSNSAEVQQELVHNGHSSLHGDMEEAGVHTAQQMCTTSAHCESLVSG